MCHYVLTAIVNDAYTAMPPNCKSQNLLYFVSKETDYGCTLKIATSNQAVSNNNNYEHVKKTICNDG